MCDTDDITSIKLVSVSGADTGYTGSALHPLHNSSIGFFFLVSFIFNPAETTNDS